MSDEIMNTVQNDRDSRQESLQQDIYDGTYQQSMPSFQQSKMRANKAYLYMNSKVARSSNANSNSEHGSTPDRAYFTPTWMKLKRDESFRMSNSDNDPIQSKESGYNAKNSQNLDGSFYGPSSSVMITRMPPSTFENNEARRNLEKDLEAIQNQQIVEEDKENENDRSSPSRK